jgi:phospholipid/cholesterol/gamma-HCH transport system substrate-binding protein
MNKHATDNIRLGFFVLSGLAFLIVLLYMTGKNRNLFGSSFIIKTKFENAQGLVAGNNVRYNGIEVGTVKDIRILTDATIEVRMLIDKELKPIIHSNAVVAIGTDGLMGNKVINISPGSGPWQPINDGDVLASRRMIDTDEMLRTFSRTNDDVGLIAANLKITISRLNNSTALWELLNDRSIGENLQTSAANVRLATERAAVLTKDLEEVMADLKNGKGSMGALLRDTALAVNLNDAVDKIRLVGLHADELATRINSAVQDIEGQVKNGKGTISALLTDTGMTARLNNTLENVEKGTEAFQENMEALKHNFLFRGYFRRQQRQKKNTQPHEPVAKTVLR